MTALNPTIFKLGAKFQSEAEHTYFWVRAEAETRRI